MKCSEKRNISHFMTMHVYGVCFNCKKGSQGILLEMMIFEPRQEPFYSIHIKEAI